MTTTRIVLGLPLAAAVTAALFLLMRALVFVESPPEEAIDVPDFDIFPEVAVIEPDDQIDIDDIPDVTPPPPIPEIPRDAAPLPDSGLGDFIGELPTFERPQIDAGNTIFIVDGDARPIIRIEPVYPNSALQRGIEGDCVMSFDVGPDGVPANIRADCTSSVFSSASIRAVERWRYDPMVVNGEARIRRNLQTRLDFQLNG